MRSLIAETLIAAILAVLVVAAALAALPHAGSETWAGRMEGLVAVAFTLRFGHSSIAHKSVIAAIAEASTRSVAIIGLTVVLVLAIAVPLGLASATHSSSRWVKTLRRGLDIASGVPLLVWSTLVYIALLRQFGIIPREEDNLPVALAAAVFVLALGDRLVADITARVELAARGILAESYMRTVRAADYGVRRHLLVSLVAPVAEAISARAMLLVGGAIVIEMIFAINGLGFTVVNAIDRRDTEPNLVLAASMALVAIGLVIRMLHRGAVAAVDPRARE